MEAIKRHLREIIVAAQHPCVMTSFGKDSLLLLHLAREVRPDISVLWFPDAMNDAQKKFAEKIIREWNLTVYAYAPSSRYFLSNETGLTLVDEYSFGEAIMPVLTDVAAGETCAANISRARTPYFMSGWDVILHGFKTTDWHALSRGYFPSDGFQFGAARLYAPLRDLTDEEVLRWIERLELPYEEIDDTLKMCTRCLEADGEVFCPEARTMIPAFKWDRQASLEVFRDRFLPQGI